MLLLFPWMLIMKRPFYQPIFFLLSLISLLNACGQAGQGEREQKEYRIYVNSDDNEVQNEFRSLVDLFNARTCAKVIALVENADDANSHVTLTKGLQKRDGKVGWGQWERISYSNNTAGSDRTLVYTMSLEFDYDYVHNRLNSDNENKRYDLTKLFSHEVGHGLQMEHDAGNVRSVMYPDISGEKDFDPFFKQVRGFFELPADASC